jgi:putative ABC transport system substrate-binding protein
MRRRDLIAAIGGAALSRPLGVSAQQNAIPVIGVLGLGSPGAIGPPSASFHQGLSETGYVMGQNVAIEYRWAAGRYDRLPSLAADLVGSKVDLIATIGGNGPALAAKRQTSTIPILFLTGDDPIATGLVASLGRPGGNLTGINILVAELNPKRLELLSELVPQTGVIALLVNPNGPQTERVIREVREAALTKRVQLPVIKAGTEKEIDAAFAQRVALVV